MVIFSLGIVNFSIHVVIFSISVSLDGSRVSRDGTGNNKKRIQINESLKNKLILFLF